MTLALITVVQVMNGLDRQILAILAHPIKTDLGLTDAQLGLLSGLAFALVYTTIGLPLASLADRLNRVRLLAAALLVWSVFAAACGTAMSFAQLAFFRMGTAAGEAGASPPAYSIISDKFPPARRGGAFAIFSLGGPTGVILAATTAGWVSAHYGWREAFLVVCSPGILLAAILAIAVKEPERGALDPPMPATPQPLVLSTVRLIARSPVLAMTMFGASLAVFCTNAIVAWAPSMFLREKGMNMGQLALYFGIVQGVATYAGILGCGRLIDRFARSSRPHLLPLIPGIGSVLSLPFVALAAASPNWQVALAFLFVPLLFAWTFLPVSITIIQNAVAANRRATAGAILLLIVGVIGIGGGPTFVGFVSDAAAAHGATRPLRFAFFALTPAFAITALLYLSASRASARTNHATLM